jgi:hypothetical protein
MAGNRSPQAVSSPFAPLVLPLLPPVKETGHREPSPPQSEQREAKSMTR